MSEVEVNGKNVTENGSTEEVPGLDESTDSPQVEVHFEPVVQLPLVEVFTNEEDEVELIKLRAKLYRYDQTETPAEWKERGTGEVKLLRHKAKNTVRIVMRRDKTLKICANHFIRSWMELNPICGSDRAWVWSVLVDFADEQPKSQLLAIRFANVENAKRWKEEFEKAKKIVETAETCLDNFDTGFDSEEESEPEKEDKKTASFSSTNEDKEHSKEQMQTKAEVTKATDNVTADLEKLKVKEQE